MFHRMYLSDLYQVYRNYTRLSGAIEILLGCQDLELGFARRKGSQVWTRRHREFVRKVSTPIFHDSPCLDIEDLLRYNR